MALQIQDKIVQTFAQPNIADIYGTYPSTLVADIAVTAASVKCAGLTVGIEDATTGVVTEYWYQPDGQGGLELVEKQQVGQAGQNAYVHIKYAASAIPLAADMHDTPQTGDKYIGVYSGNLELAPINPISYVWSKYVGEDGINGISPTVSTTQVSGGTQVTVSYGNGQSISFVVSNGTDGHNPNLGTYVTTDSGATFSPALPSAPVYASDFIVVIDKTNQSSVTSTIWVWDSSLATPAWVNSGRDANMAYFGSGELLESVGIDNTHLENPIEGSLSKAKDVMQLNVKAEKLRLEKLNKAVGRNLYNPAAALANHRIDTITGKPIATNNWTVSDFIAVEPGESYIRNNGYNGKVYYYDENFLFKSSDTFTYVSGTAFTVPAGCYFLRFDVSSSQSSVQLEKGIAVTPYAAYDETYGLLNPIKQSVLNKVEKSYGHQLFNKDKYDVGYLSNTGALSPNNPNYRVSDFMPIEANENYHVSAKGDEAVGSSNVYFWFYDIDKVQLSGNGASVVSSTKQITAPLGAAYLRITYGVSSEEIMVEKGTARSSQYEEFSEIAGYLPILRDKQVEIRHLSDALRDRIFSGSAFSGFSGSDTLAVNATLGLGTCNVKKNFMLVANVVGTVGDIKVGFGPSDKVMAGHIELTPTTMKIYYNDILAQEYIHGLALTQDTTIILCTKTDGATTTNYVSVGNGMGNTYGVGDGFTEAWPSNSRIGVGQPYITNAGTSSIEASLSFFPMDLCAKIWIFGDSYVSMDDPARWPYYLFQRNMDKWLLNGFSGEAPNEGLTDFQTLLLGGHKPTYAIWTLGMNGANDTVASGNYTIADAQAATINYFLDICSANGITPILATIPTVPSRQRTGYDNFVKSKGVRIIDFATAVGANENGQWKTGLLETTGSQVHPTVAGAKVLADRALLDFPEISIILQ